MSTHRDVILLAGQLRGMGREENCMMGSEDFYRSMQNRPRLSFNVLRILVREIHSAREALSNVMEEGSTTWSTSQRETHDTAYNQSTRNPFPGLAQSLSTTRGSRAFRRR
jgi:tryptophan synthase beta subunit